MGELQYLKWPNAQSTNSKCPAFIHRFSSNFCRFAFTRSHSQTGSSDYLRKCHLLSRSLIRFGDSTPMEVRGEICNFLMNFSVNCSLKCNQKKRKTKGKKICSGMRWQMLHPSNIFTVIFDDTMYFKKTNVHCSLLSFMVCFGFFLLLWSLSLKHSQHCFGCSTVTSSLSWQGLKSHGYVFLSCSAMLFTLWCQILFFPFC